MLTIASTLTHTPRLSLATIVTAILGPDYDLTVVFIGSQRARTLNQTHRGKSYVPNVLSFPLSETHGEIYLCPEVAKKEAANFSLSPKGYLTYLVIHGALHLAGYDHGTDMDTAEQQYLQRYNIC